jgi:predicted nucleic-acid-binding protein
MITVDTNILVRYAVKDDRSQTVKATDFLIHNQCRIVKTVLLELVWVMSSPAGYNLSKTVVIERIRHICGLPTIEVEDAVSVAQAVTWYEQGMVFADALHLASSSAIDGFATFDRQLSAKAISIETQQKVTLL